MLVEFVKLEDLKDVKLQIGPARKLLKRFQPGGDIYNALVIQGRAAGPPATSAVIAAGASPLAIEEFFRQEGLPIQAAWALTDPDGEFNYSSLPMLVEFVTFEDLTDVKLQIFPARQLFKWFQPGGDVYNALVIKGHILPQREEPPRQHDAVSLGLNSGIASSSSRSGGSATTPIPVARQDWGKHCNQTSGFKILRNHDMNNTKSMCWCNCFRVGAILERADSNRSIVWAQENMFLQGPTTSMQTFAKLFCLFKVALGSIFIKCFKVFGLSNYFHGDPEYVPDRVGIFRKSRRAPDRFWIHIINLQWFQQSLANLKKSLSKSTP